MEKEISPELIKKYLAGTCTNAEKNLLDEWYAGFETAPDGINALPAIEQNQLKENLLHQIKGNIRSAEAAAAVPDATIIQMPKPADEPGLFYYAARVAAVLVFVCGLAFIAQFYQKGPVEKSAVVAQKIFTNKSGLVKKVILADGSKVWLQENSSLTVAHDFGLKKRKVSLVGEAFFDVAKDKIRPFEIYSQNITTRVLGTSFNIKAYEKDATVEVSVVTGKVSVLSPDRLPTTTSTATHNPGTGSTVVLMPNQKVTYLKSVQNLVKKEVPRQGRRMVWAKTSLSFENSPIREVIKKLNENFATNIKLANEDINNCSIQGDFTNQNLPEILDVICKSIEADYALYKNEIVISGTGCPADIQVLP